MLMTGEELERFKRQMLHEGFTEVSQARLRASTVLLAGVGGLGGAIAYALAGAGVGKLIIVHSGALTESNLNRQTLMADGGVGQPRAMLARRRIEEYSRFTRVEAHDISITEGALAPLLRDVDLVIDARHNFPERRALNRAALERGLPLLFAAMDGLEAQMALFIPGVTGCLDCLYPEDPPDWEPFGFPVFGAVSHTIGAMAGMESVKHLAGYGSPARGLVTMSLADYRTRIFPLRPAPDCPVCARASHNKLIKEHDNAGTITCHV